MKTRYALIALAAVFVGALIWFGFGGSFFADVQHKAGRTGKHSTETAHQHDHESLGSINPSDTQFETLTEKYKTLTIKKGPTTAIKRLEEASKDDRDIMRACHNVVHLIGRTAYDKYRDFGPAIQHRDDFCNSGYVHGVIEGYFDQNDNAMENVETVCELGDDARAFDVWECNHGLGHGFMYRTDGDLNRSLKLCEDQLSDNAAQSCMNGVYMEVFNRKMLKKESQFRHPDAPFRPCRTTEYGTWDCYMYVPTYLLQQNNNDFEQTLRRCEDVSSDKFRLSCIAGVGSEALKRNMQDTDAVFALCDRANSHEGRQACARGAVSIYMNQTASAEAGRRLCPTVPDRYKKQCRKAVSTWIESYTE